MKNFKKVLALVLAVATVFSFAAMATAADVEYKDLTDTASIEHVEAVKVLTGIGVINGYEDKTFKPAENVTRVQMAKMIGYIMNYGDDINDLYKAACPFADSKSNWGAGYIAYCASQGIVNGRNATTFDPNATVTGVEAAKMLLCALGYDATIESFTGADWATKVMKVAREKDLFEDLSASKMGSALNRDDAAQMIFNALQAKPVKYPAKGTTVTVGDAVVSTGAQEAADKDAAWYTYQFKETEGQKVLAISDNKETDAFGLEAYAWQYGEDKDGAKKSIATKISLKKTFTGEITAQDIYNLFGKLEGTSTITLKLDGNSVNDPKITTTTVNASTGRANNKFKADLIEVYYTKDAAGKYQVQVIGKNYYVGKIQSFTAEKDDADAYITVTGKTFAGSLKFETNAFTKADKDSFVLCTIGKEGTAKTIQTAVAVKAVASGKVTSVAKRDGIRTIVADGKTYTLSNVYGAAAKAPIAEDDSYDLYLDPNGNIAYAEVTEEGSNDFYMVMNIIQTNSGSAKTTDDFTYELLGADGKVIKVTNAKELAGAHYAFGDGDKNNVISAARVGDIVTYKVDSEGKAELTVKATGKTKTDDAEATVTREKNATDLAKVLTPFTADSKTTFVLIALDSNGNFVATPVAGLTALKAVVENYTFYDRIGVKNDVTGKSVAFIFVDELSSVSTKAVLYKVAGTEAKEEVGDDFFGKAYLITGTEVKEVLVKKAKFETLSNGYNVLKSYKVDSNGNIDSFTAIGAKDATVGELDNATLKYVNGTLIYTGKTMDQTEAAENEFANDDIDVVIYNVKDEEFVVEKLSAVGEKDDGKLVNELINATGTSKFILTSSTDKTVKYLYAVNDQADKA